MQLYFQLLKLLIKKFIFQKSTGSVIKDFAEKMGIVYIKLAQIIATQNYGTLFTEEDRQILSSICDDCQPIIYAEIEQILKSEYQTDLDNIFSFIDPKPIGSASVSQVHRAILKNGEEVAVKVKRKDIATHIESDLKRIKYLLHHFGRIVSFKNLIGGDHALDLYLKWIYQETDFHHERENIQHYQQFADSVNGQIAGTKKIKVPKLYTEYCTDNIIVMEYIKDKTLNQIELTEENKERVITAINSYVQLSFWALFNDKTIVFHGDPHPGNICVDEEGNICFLDMGLLCVLDESESNLCREFFLSAYSGNAEKLYNMLIPYGDLNDQEKRSFKEAIQKYCEEVKTKNITNYFIDLMIICPKYQIDPPNFLFNMAKTFLCLYGISTFTENNSTAFQLLQAQVVEYLVKRSLKDCKSIAKDSLRIAPKALESTLKYGLVKGIAVSSTDEKLRQDIRKSLENLQEIIQLMKTFYGDSTPEQPELKFAPNLHL